MGRKEYQMRKRVTLDELVKIKRKLALQGVRVRRVFWGLSTRQYGRVFSADGFQYVVTDSNPDEIKRRLKEARR